MADFRQRETVTTQMPGAAGILMAACTFQKCSQKKKKFQKF